MSLEDLGNIGEFVAAVGVIISLIYLAVQIRQNTGQIRQNTAAIGNASYHQAVEQGWLVNLKVADDPEVARIMRAGYRGLQELNDDERMRFLALMQLVGFAFDSTMRLHERGLIDTEVWENLLDNNESFFRHPGVQRYFRSRQGVLSRRLRESIHQRYGVFSDEDAAHDQRGGGRL